METGRQRPARFSLEARLHLGPRRAAPEARRLRDMVVPAALETCVTGLGMDLPERAIE